MRALKVLVIVMGVLIVAGTVGLVWVIVQRVGGAVASGAASGAGFEATLRQPPGTRIGGIAALEGRLAVWLQRAGGEEEVLLLDARDGRVVGRLRVGE